MQPSGVHPCPWHKTHLGQTIQDCLQIIPLQLSALQSCISPKMVKLSINPSLEYLYSLLDSALQFPRLDLTRRACLTAWLYTWSHLQLLLHVPQTHPRPAPSLLGMQGVRMGREGEEGDEHFHIFKSLHSRPFCFVAVGWFGRSLHSFVLGTFRSDASLQSWENTLFSCKHQHIINTKPVVIPSSLKLHNSCNNRLPHPFIRVILANCCIHPTPSLPQTLCKLLRISSVPACWTVFPVVTRF